MKHKTGDNKIHIAYADDHVLVRKGIISLLGDYKEFEFDIEAENGQELLHKLETATTLPDICITDINMDKMNGFDTLVELKKRWPEIGVLVLTVFNNEPYIIKMLVNGADGYLLKNCDPLEIKQALEAIYKHGFYNSDITSSHMIHAIRNKEMKSPGFTAKEMEFLKYIGSEYSMEEIAQQMDTTPRSVMGYRDSLFKKLHVQSRTTLAIVAIQLGLIPLEINTGK